MTNTSKASVVEAHPTSANMSATPGQGTWTYPIVAGDITNEAKDFNIRPDREDLPALAQALDVLSVQSVQASMTLHRTKKSIRVRGEVKAVVVQNCVVSLEPVRQRLQEEIDRTYVASRDEVEHVFKNMNANREMMIDPDEIDPPEVIENGRLDLAAIALEHMILGIDLYPRAKGVDVSSSLALAGAAVSEEEIAKESPFAALAQLKMAHDDKG
ncbi:MAG: DUF177 domain-containing protein [Hyphomicrobiales bacterium]